MYIYTYTHTYIHIYIYIYIYIYRERDIRERDVYTVYTYIKVHIGVKPWDGIAFNDNSCLLGRATPVAGSNPYIVTTGPSRTAVICVIE